MINKTAQRWPPTLCLEPLQLHAMVAPYGFIAHNFPRYHFGVAVAPHQSQEKLSKAPDYRLLYCLPHHHQLNQTLPSVYILVAE